MLDLFVLLKAVVLGLVEGATEFIPVSSTGHLIIVSEWLSFTGAKAATFVIFIQLGAILAIVWLYREKLLEWTFSVVRSETSRRLWLNLLVAFIPAAAVGFLFHRSIKAFLFSPLVVAAALVAGGLAILVIEWWEPKTSIEDLDGVSYRTALGIGIAQVLALVPGVSRSGATIMGAYVLGCSRRVATEFSFFLAIPVMAAATLFDLWESRADLSGSDVPVFAIGFIVSFLSALVVVRGFLRFVSNHTFLSFAWYRIAFGILLLVYYGIFS